MLPTQAYRPGQAPPPHLSPFIDNSKEGYVPLRQKEINQLKGEIVDSYEEEESDHVPDEPVQVSKKAADVKQAAPAKKVPVKGDADSSSEEEDSEDEAQTVAKNKQLKQAKNLKIKKELEKEQ